MWALNLAFAAPERVEQRRRIRDARRRAALAAPRPLFRIRTTPGLGRMAAHAGAQERRRGAQGHVRSLGRRALARTPDEFFEVVRTGMGKPGSGRAIWSHVNLAIRSDRARPANVFGDD
jgi:hypothetical protein